MTFYQVALVGTNSVSDQFRAGFGVNMEGVSTAQDVATAVANAFTANYTKPLGATTFANQWPSSLKWETVSVYERPLGGGPSVSQAEASLGTLAGAGGSNSTPPETALCVSLLTGAPGRSARGRMYLPSPSVNGLDSPGTVHPSTQQAVTDWAAAFFGEVNTTARHVVVWSRKNASQRNVTQVQVGNQYDVQRRRQNNRPETYISSSVSQV